jgi:predicted Zn-dependent protease
LLDAENVIQAIYVGPVDLATLVSDAAVLGKGRGKKSSRRAALQYPGGHWLHVDAMSNVFPLALNLVAQERAADAAAYVRKHSSYIAAHRDPQVRNASEARKWARQAVALQPGNPSYLDTLAAAQAADGDFPAAVATLDRAIQMALESGKSPLAKQMAKTRSRYLKQGE